MKAALGLATEFGEAYRRADPPVRRWFNQAVVESIGVEADGRLSKIVLGEPFKTLLDKDLVPTLADQIQNRRPLRDGGSTISGLVEVMGFELTASTLRKCGSQCSDQVLLEDAPGNGVSLPSGSLTIPPLPSR